MFAKTRSTMGRAWWQLSTPYRYRRWKRWWGGEAKVHRWKVLIAAAAAVFLVASFNNALGLQASDARHQLECDRASRTENLITVLDRIVDLSDILPNNTDAIAYTSNRQSMIASMIHLVKVTDCPA